MYAQLDLDAGHCVLRSLTWHAELVSRAHLPIVAAAAAQTASSCEPVPPEQPMAPMILPPSTRGMPPREAMMSSSVSAYFRSNFCTASSNALVGRRYLAATRALCSEIAIEASWAPSIRMKVSRLAP